MERQFILLLTKFFPPNSSPASLRSLSLVQQLTNDGFNVVVLDFDDARDSRVDFDLNKLVPKEAIVSQLLARSCSDSKLPTLFDRGYVDKLSKFYYPTWAANSLLKIQNLIQPPRDALKKKKIFKKWIRENKLAQLNYQLVITTSPPFFLMPLGGEFKRRRGVPWVCDLRDLWTFNPGYTQFRIFFWLERRLEKRWLKAADVVTVVGTGMKTLVRRIVPFSTRVIVVRNGFLREDFETDLKVQVEQDQESHEIVYVGSLYGHQSPAPFLSALSDMLSRSPELQSALRVTFVGLVGRRFLPLISAFQNQWPQVLRVRGQVPHSQAIDIMKQADLLLLIVGGENRSEMVLTTKLYEYMKVGKRILQIGSINGEAASIMKKSGCGRVFHQEDKKGIAIAIGQSLRGDWKPQPNKAFIETFERRKQVRKLSKVISSLLKS